MSKEITRRLVIDGPFAAHMWSGTRKDLLHRMEINNVKGSTPLGLITCSCEGYQFHYKNHYPDIFDEAHHCRHIKRWLNWMKRKGLLKAEKPAPFRVETDSRRAA